MKQVQLNLTPAASADEKTVRKAAANIAGVDIQSVSSFRIIKKSVDARKKDIRINLTVELFTSNDSLPLIEPFRPMNVTNRREVIIVGAGPAGLFAALRLIELGLRPVILERGKDVSARKVDIAMISREHIVNEDSNYCFGEGGAGTYSDGKLYTRSKKRGDNSRVLELLYLHGAKENILYEAHPHIGTDKLPSIISSIRKSIIDSGGVFLLGKKVTDFIIENSSVSGVITSDGERYTGDKVIVATGHSARDIFEIFKKRNIAIEPKAFAMGVRVEHPQELIDRIQYHGKSRGELLPAASYNLVRQVDDRGVYSFCMCPGGFIVPSATSPEEVVVNGMSPSHRNSPYANSGIVVEIRVDDLKLFKNHGDLAGIEFQKAIERNAWIHGGQTQKAPAQRLTDFIDGKLSGSLPKVSYFPGVTSSNLTEWFPEALGNRLREGFRQFDRVMKGFVTNEAAILAVESRTSSPVRVPRDPVSLMHPGIEGLYPVGEGAGYSGGIVSSAVDGMKTAEAISKAYGI